MPTRFKVLASPPWRPARRARRWPNMPVRPATCITTAYANPHRRRCRRQRRRRHQRRGMGTRYRAPFPVRRPGRRRAIKPAVLSVPRSAERLARPAARFPAPPICSQVAARPRPRGRRPALPGTITTTAIATHEVSREARSVRIADENEGRAGDDRALVADKEDVGVLDLTRPASCNAPSECL